MVTEVRIPLLGMNMQEATILKWAVNDFHEVKKGDHLAEIETDKAVYEIEAPDSGFLKIIQHEGKVVPVGGIIGIIGFTLKECKDEFGRIQNYQEQNEILSQDSAKQNILDEPKIIFNPELASIKISAVARKMAEKYGIDISKIKATDPAGRINKEDVERAIQEQKRAKDLPTGPIDQSFPLQPKSKIPLIGKKRSMAQRLTESLRVMAQMTNWEDIDMSRLLQLKESGMLEKERSPLRLTLNDFFVKLLAQAIKEYPLINSSLIEDEIIIWENINIAVAVARGDDLLTPVIKDADKKSIKKIGEELTRLISRARENRLSVDEISGSTISISNIGALGANPGTPIIQIPHAAIIGFGAVEKKAVVLDEQIIIRPMMLMAVTVDHRFITGAVSAQFRKHLKNLIETADQEILLKCS